MVEGFKKQYHEVKQNISGLFYGEYFVVMYKVKMDIECQLQYLLRMHSRTWLPLWGTREPRLKQIAFVLYVCM